MSDGDSMEPVESLKRLTRDQQIIYQLMLLTDEPLSTGLLTKKIRKGCLLVEERLSVASTYTQILSSIKVIARHHKWPNGVANQQKLKTCDLFL